MVIPIYSMIGVKALAAKCQGFSQCALRRTFLTGESPQSALVVGRIQPNTKGVHREVESEGR